MAWLAIQPGQTVTLQLTEGIMHQRRSHWVDRSAHECTGATCVYCRGGAKARLRYFIAVQLGQDALTWEFPLVVQDQILNALGGPDKVLGATLSVRRDGEGLATRYSIMSVGAASAVGASALPLAPGASVRVENVPADVVAALAAFQPVLITEVSNAVWGLLMSAPYLDAVSDGVVMKLKAKAGLEPSILELLALHVAESVGQVLVAAGVVEDEGMGGDAELKGEA